MAENLNDDCIIIESPKNEIVVVSDSEDEDDGEKEKDEQEKSTENSNSPSLICPICLESAIHPARLPCGHIFCFLCVKGVAYKDNRCAMCRRDIPSEFLQHPQLVNGIEDLCKTKTTEDGYQWFYEGRGGWWQYDDRTSQDIEDAYKKDEKFCTILVAGYVYIVDFEHMLQQRQNDPTRVRHVKRDLATVPKKGVAGLRIVDGSTIVTDTITTNDSDSHTNNYDLNINRQNRFQHPSSSNIISPISNIISADAALRIASNIIENNSSNQNDTNDDEQLNTSRELLEETEELLEAAQEANIATPDCDNILARPITTSDLFAQTLEDFRSLTIRNVIDSSDSEDENQQIIL